jgi:hypothetical protein
MGEEELNGLTEVGQLQVILVSPLAAWRKRDGKQLVDVIALVRHAIDPNTPLAPFRTPVPLGVREVPGC